MLLCIRETFGLCAILSLAGSPARSKKQEASNSSRQSPQFSARNVAFTHQCILIASSASATAKGDSVLPYVDHTAVDFGFGQALGASHQLEPE